MATEFIPVAIAQFWQVTLLILVVAALSRWLSPKRPHLSHLLWLVVLIKCVTPPLWASPGGVFCWLQPEQQIDTPLVEHIEWTPVAWDEMLDVENTSLVDSEVSDAPFAGVYLDETSDAELTTATNVVEPAPDEPSVGWFADAAFASWSVISCLVLLGVTIRWLRFWKLVRSSPRRDSTELDTMLQTLSKRLGVRRRVRLIVTESLVGPAVVGFFRVTVLIPSVVADKLKGESVAPILAHELLHVRRGDLWIGLLQTVAQALWWFHPLVWWVGRVTSREAERCCDEEVLGELKCDPASYARALLDVLDLKTQLKPVPVFPGVRPVDVTSQRLERIMTLRQGCRRRSPLWCWLVAIGAAALTLPGAAFVVTAQEEEPAESTTKEESRALPAPPAYVGPGPFPPMPLPQDAEVTAYAFGKGNDTPITEVYDITEFMPLLSGSESEQQRKFERLVKSRDPAHDAQINWFNGRPVVKTTATGHAAVRQCIDIFIGSGATSETIDEFVGSVSTQLDGTLICDLQVVSVSDDAYSRLEDIALEHSKDRPWVISADTWDAAVESVNSDETFHFLAPRCAVFNGRAVTVDSGGEHPVSFKREDDGRLILGKNWSGWKTQLLPFVRNDGTFWLGVSFENGKIVGRKSLSPQQVKQTDFEGATTIHEYQHVEFSTTLKEGQLVVLPGFTVAYDHETPRATLMTARVRRQSTKSSPKAVASPRQLSGTGVNSDAGITGEVVLDQRLTKQVPEPNTPALQDEVNEVPARPLSDFLRLHETGWAVVVGKPLSFFARPADGKAVTAETFPRVLVMPLILSAEPSTESKKLFAKADLLAPGFPDGNNTYGLVGNVSLSLPTAKLRVTASSARVSQPSVPFISFELVNAELTDFSDGTDSVTKAPAIVLMLNAATWKVDRIEVNRTPGKVILVEPFSPPFALREPNTPVKTNIGIGAVDDSSVGNHPFRGTVDVPTHGSEGRAGKVQSTTDPTKGDNERASRRHGPYLVEFGLTPEYRERLQPGNHAPHPSNTQITVSHSEADRKESPQTAGKRLGIRADQNSFRIKDNALNLLLKGDVELRVEVSSPKDKTSFFTATADSLQISLPKSPAAGAATSIPCRMTKATVRYGVGGEATPSMIRAEEIIVELDAETFEIASLNASKVDSLQVSDVKRKAARTRHVFPESRELSSQWDTIRRRRSFQKLVSPNFDQTPLKDAIAWFRDSANLNIIIDELSIEEEGVRTTTPVTLQLKDVRADSALRLMLGRFSLGVMVDEESGVVVVTSRLHMKGKMVAAAYPVADLVIPRPKAVVVRLSDSEASLREINPLLSHDGILLASNKIQDHPQLDFDSIGELITTVVEPNSWMEVGGRGTLRTNETTLSLVIRQTQDVHREISDLLDQLRRLQDIQVSLQMQTLDLPGAFLEGWNDGLTFKPLSESTTHRYLQLTSAQADELRKAGESEQFPKVTLFNGQLCELRMDEQDGMKQNWHVQPVVSGDRQAVRLGVGIDDGRTGAADKAVPTSVTTVADGAAILVEVNGSADNAGPIVGAPIPGQPRAFRQVSQPRRFVLIQPKVVIVEEEKELLSTDLEK